MCKKRPEAGQIDEVFKRGNSNQVMKIKLTVLFHIIINIHNNGIHISNSDIHLLQSHVTLSAMCTTCYLFSDKLTWQLII